MLIVQVVLSSGIGFLRVIMFAAAMPKGTIPVGRCELKLGANLEKLAASCCSLFSWRLCPVCVLSCHRMSLRDRHFFFIFEGSSLCCGWQYVGRRGVTVRS
jgi:hypothetical protein